MIRRPIAAMRELAGQSRCNHAVNRSRIPAGEIGHRRFHEQVETDEAAHRIARQPEDQRSAVGGMLFNAEPEWLARLHTNLVKHLADSQIREGRGNQIENSR